MIDPSGILMIEPKGSVSQEPVVDELTRKIAAAWRQATHAEDGYRGFHQCECGACSDNKDHWIDGLLTNALCVHYVAFHRQEIPKEEIAKITALKYGEVEPTEKELNGPFRLG